MIAVSIDKLISGWRLNSDEIDQSLIFERNEKSTVDFKSGL